MPPFDVQGGLALVLARGLATTGILGAFGTLLFAVLVLPRALVRASAGVAAGVWPAMRRLALAELALAGLATPAWLVLASATMAGTATSAAALAAAGVVLRDTAFGHLVLLTMLGVLATAAVLGRGRGAIRWRPALLLAGAAAVLQAGHSHAWSMAGGPSLLVLSDVLHLLAAGAWLGGLPPLLLVAWLAPPGTTAAAARWFTPLGKGCVVVLVASAAAQFWALVGGLPTLVGTPYDWTAGLKAVLLLALLGFAVLNRYRLAPALQGGHPELARRRLVRSLVAQTSTGLLAVLAAALLSSLPPAIHEQPLWPFPLRPSLAVLSDPDLRREVAWGLLLGGAAVAAAVAGIVTAAVWRPRRRAARGLAPLAAALLAAALLWLAAPHLGLLLVEAYPTSYYASPTGFAAASIVRGAALFGPNCAGCHGADGHGDGPIARSVPVPPADLTAPHLWEHADGELFWWISHGIEAPEGGMAMPGFAGTLTVEQRWALIDYVRAHNAGVAMRETGAWDRPVPAPNAAVTCDGQGGDVAALHGRVVRLIVAAGDPVAPAAPGNGIERVDVFMPRPPPSRAGACAAPDRALPAALAVLTGGPEAALAGNQFLIDPDGWLRARWRPGEPDGWSSPAALLAAITAICATPVGNTGGDHAHHHH